MQKNQNKKYRYFTLREEAQPQKQSSTKNIDLDMLDSQELHIFADKGNLGKTLARIEEHRAKSLDYSFGGEQMLNYISSISFPRLAVANLYNSKIASVEVLPRIRMSHLKQLHADCNNIVILKSLRRADFPHLQAIGIKDNQLKQFDGLSEAHFPDLEWLSVENLSKTGPEDLSCLLKISATTIKQLIAVRLTRIDQASIRTQLKRKNLKVQIQYFQL